MGGCDRLIGPANDDVCVVHFIRQKLEIVTVTVPAATTPIIITNNSVPSGKGAANLPKRKYKVANRKLIGANMSGIESSLAADGHMTAEEVERHLQSRQSMMELVPERAPATVPNEMFSNEPSLDRWVPFNSNKQKKNHILNV